MKYQKEYLGKNSLKFNISFIGRHWDFAKAPESFYLYSEFIYMALDSRYWLSLWDSSILADFLFLWAMPSIKFMSAIKTINYIQIKAFHLIYPLWFWMQRIRDEVGSRIECSLLSSSHPCQLCSDKLWSSLRIKRVSGKWLVLLVVIKV